MTKSVECKCNICKSVITNDEYGIGLYFHAVYEDGERISSIIKKPIREAENHVCNECLTSLRWICEHIFV